MNYYHCYWFSEINDTQREVDILVAHTDPNHARMVASWYVTNISHFDNYPIDINEFWAPRFIINHEWEQVEIISSLFTIKEAFRLLTDIGMDVASVDSLAHPLKPGLQRIIWGMLRKELGISNDDPFTAEIEDDVMVNGELTATQLITITDLITHILQDARELYVKTKGVIWGENMILFTKSIEMLQQTLSRGDIMLAKEQTKKLIELMEHVEWEYIEYERARDHQVESQIVIPNLNTILAHNQWVSAHKLYDLQTAENNKVEQRYQTIYRTVFLKWVLYLKWIYSEIWSTVWSHGNMLSYFVRKFEYMVILMSSIVVIILESWWHSHYRGNVLYVIGLAWIALQFSHIVHTQRRYLKLAFLWWWIICSMTLWYFIASNLALI